MRHLRKPLGGLGALVWLEFEWLDTAISVPETLMLCFRGRAGFLRPRAASGALFTQAFCEHLETQRLFGALQYWSYQLASSEPGILLVVSEFDARASQFSIVQVADSATSSPTAARLEQPCRCIGWERVRGSS